MVRHRAWIAGAWIVAGVLLLPAAGRVEHSLDVAARIHGSESAAVEQELARRFASPFATFAVLVVTGVPGPQVPAGRAALEQVVAGLRKVPGVTRCFSYLDAQDTLFGAATGAGSGTYRRAVGASGARTSIDSRGLSLSEAHRRMAATASPLAASPVGVP